MERIERIGEQLKSAGFLVTLDYEVESAGAAWLLNITPKTLRNWRCELQGPHFRHQHSLILYSIEDVLTWKEENERTPASL
jgi:hypothetical protein